MIKNLSEQAQKSIEALLSREDVAFERSVFEEYIRTGAWSEKSAVDYLENHVQKKPHEVAMVDEDGHRITWTQFDEITDAFALNLIRLGFKPGDFLGVQLPNWSEFFIALMGAIKARVLISNFHLTYREHELAGILGHTRARGLIVPAFLRGYNYARLALRVKRQLPHLVHVITARGYSEKETIPFETMTRTPGGLSRKNLEEIRPNGFDPLLTLITSGTTGQPKIVMHIHNTFLYPGYAYREMLGLKERDRGLVITPVGHSTAVSQFFWGFLQGTTLVLLSLWNAEKAVELIEREKTTYSIGPAVMWADVVNLPGVEKRDLSSMRLIIYGGAPMPAPLVRKLHEIIKCDIVPFYGYSEGTGHTTCKPGTSVEIVSASVGHNIIGSTSKLVDESGNEVPDGTPGEFWARGPNISVGYWGQPEYTRRLKTPDGWFKSGDVLVRDKNGYYQYVARLDDVINRGGEKIDPKEVEDLLLTHPKVANVALIGMPEKRLGSIACAFVVPKGDPPTLEELRSFLSEKGLARWKWPERLVLKEQLPYNPSGKMMRFALREEAERLALS